MNYQWTVIGAGPAGIASVGKLIDHGVDAKNIAWIDPHFAVGDFGTRWRNVPSNTKVELFIKFLESSPAFNFNKAPKEFSLLKADKHKTCELNLMVEPLLWVTHHLKDEVNAVQDTAENISLHDRLWHIQLKNSELKSQHVILATGADPRNLAFNSLVTIPLQDAMDAEAIKTQCNTDDTIAVFGSSHSAILVLKNLVECNIKKIINFYRTPLRYAVYLKDWILFDDTGLKGPTADWARNHLDGNLPQNLKRVFSNKENIEHYLPQCDKVIYAVGFERRALPVIEDLGHVSYIEQAGILAPGLFGIGIGFPEAKYNPIGVLEYRVGLWKFMEYLDRILPIWLKYHP